MKNKKFIIAGLVILAAVAVYFLFFRKKDSLAAVPAVDTDDQMYYDKMHSLLAANIDPSALGHWLGDLVKEAYQTGGIHPDYLINGKVTKTGALLATYARAYYGYGYKNKMNEADLNNELYRLFYEYKGKHNKL